VADPEILKGAEDNVQDPL